MLLNILALLRGALVGCATIVGIICIRLAFTPEQSIQLTNNEPPKFYVGSHHTFMNSMDRPKLVNLPWYMKLPLVQSIVNGVIYTQKRGVVSQVERGVRVFDLRLDVTNMGEVVVSHHYLSDLHLHTALLQLSALPKKEYYLMVGISFSATKEQRKYIASEASRILEEFNDHHKHFTVVKHRFIWFDHKEVQTQEQYIEFIHRKARPCTAYYPMLAVNTFTSIRDFNSCIGGFLLSCVLPGLLVGLLCAFVTSMGQQAIVLAAPYCYYCTILMWLVCSIAAILVSVHMRHEAPMLAVEQRTFDAFNLTVPSHSTLPICQLVWMYDFV